MTTKRYTTREEIEHDIESCISKSRRLMIQADEMDAEADTMFRLGDATEQEAAKTNRSKAKKLRRTATNLVEKKVRALSQKLAEFCTAPMPFVDQSVSAKLK